MSSIWIILITFSFLYLVHSKNEECISPRKWQVGNTIYENRRVEGILYVHAKCSMLTHSLSGRRWNECRNRKPIYKPAQCTGGETFYWCAHENRWNFNNTEYEVIKAGGLLFVIAKCNQLGFAVEGVGSVPCTHVIRQQSLPQCKYSATGECEHGKKWSAKDTVYEIFQNDVGLIVSARCNKPGFHMGENKWASCENGRIPTRLPLCRYGTEYCSDLAEPTNGYISCNANAPAKHSICTFDCKATHYSKGSKQRKCMENLQWTGSQFECIVRPECPTPPPLLNGTVDNCSPGTIIKYGDSCNFRCNAGLTLIGPSKLTCKKIGKLADNNDFETLPKCVDPCANRSCSHYCRIKQGAAECYCHDDFRLDGDGKTCTKKPEKRVEIHTINTYRIPGEVSETFPSYINTCNYNNGGCNHYCKEENETIYCSCSNGFELQRTNNKTCEDINECLSGNFGCSDDCINTEGGAHCSCPKGFKLKKDGKHCTDIDECKYKFLNKCDHNCNNNNGSYTCSCRPGYVPINNFMCEDVNECSIENFGCSDRCINTPGHVYCSCPKGYRLKRDGKHCTDIDECAREDSNYCEQICHNTKGGYTCSCHPGFVLINDFKCEGCRINSYRSSSDTACVDCPSNSHTNSDGKTSLEECLCNRGFYGNISNDEPCRDINECDSGNYGCSDNCVNTLGSAFCSCRQGFQLEEDQKTCIDVDECSVKNGGCQGMCHNSIGSFKCTCQEGYTVSEIDNYACDDVDECKENNGGCSGECINFLGGYQCSCAGDSHLGVDGKTCRTFYCSEAPVPYHSRLVCFPESKKTDKSVYNGSITSHSDKLPVGTLCKIKCSKGYTIEESSSTIRCQRNGIWNNTVYECNVSQCPPLNAPENGDVHPPECKEGSRTVKEKCYFTCNEGYRMTENITVFICKPNLKWNYNHIPHCGPERITPYVTCPSDVTIDLLPGQNSREVILLHPLSNMEDIQVAPDWVDFERRIEFPAGKTDIIVTARSLNFNNLNTSCTLSVMVIDNEFPEFIGCPEAIVVSGSNVDGVLVYWEEPMAVDNVGIKSVLKNAEPNSTWFPGIHIIDYSAEDFAGNIVRCSFEINITSPECGDLADPENGEANCQDWVYGKLCEPSCNLNYTRGEEDLYYVCDDNGTWSPSNVISPCLPECEYKEIWSRELEKCVDIGMNATDTNFV